MRAARSAASIVRHAGGAVTEARIGGASVLVAEGTMEVP